MGGSDNSLLADASMTSMASFSSWASDSSTESGVAAIRRKRLGDLGAQGYRFGARSDGELVWYKRRSDGSIQSVTTDSTRLDTSHTC